MQNKLSVQIDELARLSVDGDPRVKKATEKREALERQLAGVSSRIEQLNAQVSKQEEAAAEQMLAGGAAAVEGVNRIRRQISDAEGEIKIMSLAIERARQSEEGVRKSVRVELRKRALELFVAVQAEFTASFRKLVEDNAAREKAHSIAYRLGLTYYVKKSSFEVQLFELEEDLAGYKRDLGSEAWQEN
jgi:hypothetical protein